MNVAVYQLAYIVFVRLFARIGFHAPEFKHGERFTILAYHLLHAIEFTLRNKAINTTWASIKRVLTSHTYSTITLPTVDGPVINLRKAGIPESVHQQIYDKLGVNYSNLPAPKTIA